jgi:hypothetical protein
VLGVIVQQTKTKYCTLPLQYYFPSSEEKKLKIIHQTVIPTSSTEKKLSRAAMKLVGNIADMAPYTALFL